MGSEILKDEEGTIIFLINQNYIMMIKWEIK